MKQNRLQFTLGYGLKWSWPFLHSRSPSNTQVLIQINHPQNSSSTVVITRFIRLPNNDSVFPWGNLFYNQLDDFKETIHVTDSKQMPFRWPGSHLNHLINTRHGLTSHSNHVYGHTILFQCFSFGNGQMAVEIWLAISKKKDCFCSKRTDIFWKGKKWYQILRVLIPFLPTFSINIYCMITELRNIKPPCYCCVFLHQNTTSKHTTITVCVIVVIAIIGCVFSSTLKHTTITASRKATRWGDFLVAIGLMQLRLSKNYFIPSLNLVVVMITIIHIIIS